MIYDHQTVFSLHDEDLGLCDRLKHIILTTTDKPIYLPHQTISVQLQMEVQQYLDTWLQQGIISPSHSPYASQVVIVQKKLGEIHLCIDSRALNAITVCDSFPLPHIEEALQAVKAAVWFTSFDFVQGYLQLAMLGSDIHKTTFRAGSSGNCCMSLLICPLAFNQFRCQFLSPDGNVPRWSCDQHYNTIVLPG